MLSYTHTHPLYFSFTRLHKISLSYIHTHTRIHTHTQTQSLSLSPAHTQTFSLSRLHLRLSARLFTPRKFGFFYEMITRICKLRLPKHRAVRCNLRLSKYRSVKSVIFEDSSRNAHTYSTGSYGFLLRKIANEYLAFEPNYSVNTKTRSASYSYKTKCTAFFIEACSHVCSAIIVSLWRPKQPIQG